jgi:hypothetical protein
MAVVEMKVGGLQLALLQSLCELLLLLQGI